MKGRLVELVERFVENPEANQRALRELLSDDSLRFCFAALDLLKTGSDTPGLQFLAAALVKEDLLLGPICDPALLSRQEAIRVGKLAARADPLLDVKLARKMPALADAQAEQVLAILGAISDGSRLVPMLAILTRHDNPRVRSKAAKLIGRAIQNPEWVQSRLQEPDSRVRANIIEALWGVDSPAARDLLKKAAQDPHWRVAGNALVGLHKLGETAAIALLRSMLLRPEATWRTAAAWAMGETGDPRFLSELARLTGEPRQPVQLNIAHAVERLQLARTRALQGGRVQLRLAKLEKLPDGSRRLVLAIAPADEGTEIQFSATHFLVCEDSQPVTDYRVRALGDAERLVVGFVLCREGGLSDQDIESAEKAVHACLKQKRTQDQWAVMKSTEAPVRFTGDRAALLTALKRPAAEISDPAEALAMWNQLLESVARLRGNRNLIVLAGPESGLAAREPATGPTLGCSDLDLVRQAAAAQGIAVHAVVTGSFSPPHALECFCRGTGGAFLSAEGPQEIPSRYQQIYSSLLNRYEITYRPEPGPAHAQPQRVEVQIYSPHGCGEDAASF